MAPNGTGTTCHLVAEDVPDRMPLNLKSEVDRCKTFESWPVNFLPPDKLAAAGFYYLRREDIVKCVFCDVEIGLWEEGDDPFKEHQRWSSLCPYLRRIHVGNIPKDPNHPPIVPDSNNTRSCDTCGPYGLGTPSTTMMANGGKNVGEQVASVEEIGIHMSTGPVYSQYSTQDARLSSYEGIWPVSMKQRPDKLSEAGFFYTGKGDRTMCFYCGRPLKDWKATDDPFVEHALWSPKCSYILHLKGKEFVDMICGEKGGLKAAEDTKDIEVPSELQEAVQIRKHEEKESSSSDPLPVSARTTGEETNAERLCKLCYQEEMGVVFLPCGHLVACVKCASSLNTCAICRKSISATVRTFLS